MALLGEAAVAMWWNVAPEHRSEFHEWHSKEHLPERLGIPGFLRGSRWESLETPGDFFVLYELEGYGTLTSPGYLARLNAPTPWSLEMMPRHLGMIRSQCRIVSGAGVGVAGIVSPLRLSPEAGAEARLEAGLGTVFARLFETPGITGAHLLRTQTPAAAQTYEQKIRGGDAVADWIVLLSGHSAPALQSALAGPLSAEALAGFGASSTEAAPLYRLVHALTSADA